MARARSKVALGFTTVAPEGIGGVRYRVAPGAFKPAVRSHAAAPGVLRRRNVEVSQPAQELSAEEEGLLTHIATSGLFTLDKLFESIAAAKAKAQKS